MNLLTSLGQSAFNIISLLEYVGFLLIISVFLFQMDLFCAFAVAEDKEKNFKHTAIRNTVLVLVFGSLAMYSTVSGIPILGAIANARDMAPLIAGIFGGPVAGIGAGLLGALFRYWYGTFNPAFALTALPCAVATVTAGIVGGLVHYWKKGQFISPLLAGIIGFCIETYHMVLVLFFSQDFQSARVVVENIALPMILANVVGLVIFAYLFNYNKQITERREKFKRLEGEVNVIHSLQTDILPKLNNDLATDTAVDKDFSWLVPYMKSEHLKKDHVLFNKSDRADKLFYIKTGILRLKEINKQAGKGEIIGETGIFSPFQERTLTAICESDMDIAWIDQKRIRELVEQFPSLLYELTQLTIKRTLVNMREVISSKEKMESELQIAKAIQRSMLPNKLPINEFVDIHATMEPARQVGGDFYDYFFIDQDQLCIIIGDVTDKGIPASLFMVISKTLLKRETCNGILPHQVLTRVNEYIAPDNSECMFVTVFIAIFDLKQGVCRFANAGHNPPLLKKAGKDFEFMDPHKGFVLGGIPGVEYKTEEFPITEGDTLLLYTDGVNEALNSEKEQYGNQRFRNTLNTITWQEPLSLIEGVRNSMELFVKNAEQSDDITMLCVKINALKK
ncbi:MAG: SpoIIE family protein phosphatase [Spirochaetia bacterium]